MNNKRKICMIFNSLEESNGVSGVAIFIANLLAKKENVEITLIPIYRCSSKALKRLDPQIKVRKFYGFYFHGFSKIAEKIPVFLYTHSLKLHQYDTVIAFQYGIATKIVGSAKLSSDVKKIAWMHGYDNGLKMRKYYERIGHVVCVSKTNAKKLLSEMSQTMVVDYCYNPINDEKITKDGECDIAVKKDKSPLFISVGRHSEEKGYSRLLDIVHRLINEKYVFSLWLVGDGPQHNFLLKKSEDLKLQDYVKFIGAQSNPHKYTSKADLFICSSFSEGYSTACTEAVMLGIPVLTTNVSGGEEIVKEAESGYITQIDDESLYKGLKYVLDNPTVLTEWKTILNISKSKFSQKIRAKQLYHILQIN